MLSNESQEPVFDLETYTYLKALYTITPPTPLMLTGGRLLSDGEDHFDLFPSSLAKLGLIDLSIIHPQFKLPQVDCQLNKFGEEIYKLHAQEYLIFFAVITSMAKQILYKIDIELEQKPSLILTAIKKFLQENHLTDDTFDYEALTRKNIFEHLCSCYLHRKMQLAQDQKIRTAFNGLYLCTTVLYNTIGSNAERKAFNKILRLLSKTALAVNGEFTESPYFKNVLSDEERQDLLHIRQSLPNHSAQLNFDNQFVQMMTAVGKGEPVDILYFTKAINLTAQQNRTLFNKMLKKHHPGHITTGILLQLHRACKINQSHHNKNYKFIQETLDNYHQQKGSLEQVNPLEINFIIYLYLLLSLVESSQYKDVYKADIELLWMLSSAEKNSPSHVFFNLFSKDKAPRATSMYNNLIKNI